MSRNTLRKDDKAKPSGLRPPRYGSQPSTSSRMPSRLDPSLYMPLDLGKTIGRASNAIPNPSLLLSKRDRTSSAHVGQSNKKDAMNPLDEGPPKYPNRTDTSARLSARDQMSKLVQETSNIRLNSPSLSKAMGRSVNSVASFKLRPPSFAKSTLRTPKDLEMASRQSQLGKLSEKETLKQKAWQREQIKIAGACPGNLPWQEVKDGFQCVALQHKVTHEMLQEGRGGTFFLARGIFSDDPRLKVPGLFVGPYYLDTRGCQTPLEGVWRLSEMKDKPDCFPETLDYGGLKIL